MVALRQSSFSGGLLGPQLLGRVELQKYTSGFRTLENFIVTRTGAMENRSGTMYTATTSNGGMPVRLVKFGSTVGQGLLLEFGNLYVRFFKNGAAIQHQATLGPWIIGTIYTLGQVVTYSGVEYVALVLTQAGQQPDISPAYWAAQTSSTLQIPTVIPQASIAAMQFVQINDVMYLVNQGFYPQVLSRFADDEWTIANFVAGTGINDPTGVTATAGNPSTSISAPTNLVAVGGSGTPLVAYQVVAYRNSTGAFSTPTIVTGVNQPSGGSPVVLTWNAVATANGYAIYRGTSVTAGIIGVTSSLTFTDVKDETSNFGATAIAEANQTPAGSQTFSYEVTAVSALTNVESLASSVATCTGATPTSANPNVIHWVAVANAASYNIYKSANGVYGFIGSSSSTTFNDNNIIPSTSQQPPASIVLFQTTNDYPAVVGAYQQRLMFANTVNQPQTVWGSVVGTYTAFTTTIPALDSGAIQFTIAGRQRQYVQALVDIGKLVIHTSNGEYVAFGNQFNALTPSAINLQQNGYAGSALLVPVSIGSTALFVQARGNILRDLQYSIYSTTFTGKDTTLYVPQLFENQTITCMDWQQVYNSIIWVVQANGALQGLTYIKDQEMWAWHTHAFTNGAVEQVCVVQEGTQDVVYFVVKRTINGATVRYIERLSAREFTDTVSLSDAIFTDCSLTYDGRNTGSRTMTVTTATAWTPQNTLTITASTAYFSAGDVGNDIVLQQLDDDGLVSAQITFTIIGYTSTTVVKALAQANVPTWAQATATTGWGKAVHHFTGLGHLEGQAITAQGDGSVVLNAETDQTPTVVTGGAFTTAGNYLVLTAGLPLVAQFQTLPIEGGSRDNGPMGNNLQRVVESTITLYNSRSGSFGQDFQHLNAWKQRGLQNEVMGQNPALFTGPTTIPIQGSWQTTGQICGQQTDPLPLAISSIILSTFQGG